MDRYQRFTGQTDDRFTFHIKNNTLHQIYTSNAQDDIYTTLPTRSYFNLCEPVETDILNQMLSI